MSISKRSVPIQNVTKEGNLLLTCIQAQSNYTGFYISFKCRLTTSVFNISSQLSSHSLALKLIIWERHSRNVTSLNNDSNADYKYCNCSKFTNMFPPPHSLSHAYLCRICSNKLPFLEVSDSPCPPFDFPSSFLRFVFSPFTVMCMYATVNFTAWKTGEIY